MRCRRRTARGAFGGACSVSRCRRGRSDRGEWVNYRTSAVKGRHLSHTAKKNRRKSKAPELLDELVLEILVRLPVKSLVRFKSVSKAWHGNITDPSFIRAHLQRRASEWKQNPSMLITPHTLDRVIPGELLPTTFSNRIRFYQWQQGSSVATFVHGEDFPSEFNSACFFAHCDGLVLAPTDTKVFLFNPATRDTITLPESNRNNNKVRNGECLPVGLGLDPRTRKYKVVRSFYRSRDPHTDIYSMGMEVYIVGSSVDSWRETAVDPPYAVADFITAKSVRGAMFWIIDKHHVSQCPHGLLRFSLEDETFDITCLPDSLDTELNEPFLLDVMHGEQLCLTARSTRRSLAQQPFMVWALAEDAGLNSRWEPRYQVHVSDLFRPMALLPDGALMLWAGHNLFRYEFEDPELTNLCELEGLRYQSPRAGTFETIGHNIYGFNVVTYTESLVPITSA